MINSKNRLIPHIYKSTHTRSLTSADLHTPSRQPHLQAGFATRSAIAFVAGVAVGVGSLAAALSMAGPQDISATEQSVAADPKSPTTRESAESILSKLLQAIDRRDYAGVRVFANSLFDERRDVDIAAVMGGLSDPVLRSVTQGDVELLNALAVAAPVFGAADERGRRAIHLAAVNDHAEVIEWLVAESNASVNEKIRVTRMTPLHLAASSGSTDSIAALLRLGADPTARNASGATPLMLAAEHGHAGSVRAILFPWEAAIGMGILNATNAHGNTALHIAVLQDDPECVSSLLDAGAQSDLANADGLTAKQMAMGIGNTAITTQLR